MGIVLTYLLLTRYGGGDFILYYTSAVHNAASITNFDFSHFTNLGITNYKFVTSLFSILFVFLPPSIIGLSILCSTIIHIAYMYFYQQFSNVIRYKWLFFVLLFGTPSIVMQSSYIGKETVVIPLLIAIICLLYNKSNRIFLIGLLCIIIFLIRPYQGIMIVCSFFIIGLFRVKFLYKIFLIGLLSIILYMSIIFYMTRYSLSLSEISKVLAIAYSGGNFEMSPYKFPFVFLQLFRPFLWETQGNFLAYIVSIQNTALLILFVYGLLFWRRSIFSVISTRFIYKFLTLFFLLQFIVFSYDPNVADLTRRVIYIFPIGFLLLLLQKKSEPHSKKTFSSIQESP